MKGQWAGSRKGPAERTGAGHGLAAASHSHWVPAELPSYEWHSGYRLRLLPPPLDLEAPLMTLPLQGPPQEHAMVQLGMVWSWVSSSLPSCPVPESPCHSSLLCPGDGAMDGTAYPILSDHSPFLCPVCSGSVTAQGHRGQRMLSP